MRVTNCCRRPTRSHRRWTGSRAAASACPKRGASAPLPISSTSIWGCGERDVGHVDHPRVHAREAELDGSNVREVHAFEYVEREANLLHQDVATDAESPSLHRVLEGLVAALRRGYRRSRSAAVDQRNGKVLILGEVDVVSRIYYRSELERVQSAHIAASGRELIAQTSGVIRPPERALLQTRHVAVPKGEPPVHARRLERVRAPSVQGQVRGDRRSAGLVRREIAGIGVAGDVHAVFGGVGGQIVDQAGTRLELRRWGRASPHWIERRLTTEVAAEEPGYEGA